MSDRHPKWQRVEPGTVVPAGQPYRTERRDHDPHFLAAREFHGDAQDFTITATSTFDFFVDSSWRPPLELPTEPTWGVLVHEDRRNGAVTVGEFHMSSIGFFGGKDAKNVIDFIPLTDEQVARIEAGL